MERDSFVFYRSFYEAIKCLGDTEAIECFKAIADYALDGIDPEIEGAARAVFITVKPQIDANYRKYLNGCKGGKPKANQDVTKIEPKANQRITKVKPNVNDNDNENVNENVNDKDKVDYQLIADMYNNTCVSFPKLTKLSDSRKKAIKARLNKYSIEDIQNAFDMAEESDFLKGSNNRNWSANFDWLMKDNNLAKVLDGNYKNKTSKIEMDGKLRQFIDKNQVVDFGM